MKILVTGGTGYIGSHTVVALIEAGHEVLIIDNLSNSRKEVVDGIFRITGHRPLLDVFDLQDRERFLKFFQSHAPVDGIIHFAASKAVGESVENPLKYYRNNLLSLINTLELALRFQVNNFVFSSSCTVYGQPDELPVTEKSPIMPAASPYGATKRISEEIITDAVAANRGFQAISLRYFNPIGAHPSAHIGELPLGVPDNLVPYITQTAAGIRKQVKVFGNDYNTPDGTAIRDYIHVMDLAEAHLAALEHLKTQKTEYPNEVYNIGTGQGYSVLEVIRAFEKVSGQKLKYQITGRRSGDVEQVWADASKAKNQLGWEAKLKLEEMMLSAWKWEQNFRKKNN